jgi:hypothetical protein
MKKKNRMKIVPRVAGSFAGACTLSSSHGSTSLKRPGEVLSWWIDGARQGSNREIEYRRQKRRVKFPYLTAAFSSSRWEFNPRSPVERGAKTAPLHAIVAGNLRRHTQRGFEYGVSYPHLSCDQRIA